MVLSDSLRPLWLHANKLTTTGLLKLFLNKGTSSVNRNPLFALHGPIFLASLGVTIMMPRHAIYDAADDMQFTSSIETENFTVTTHEKLCDMTSQTSGNGIASPCLLILFSDRFVVDARETHTGFLAFSFRP